jgi:AraC-like DNA-binding protein
MSAQINGIIPRQAYEIIRDRICQILVEELNNQYAISGIYALQKNAQVFMERMVRFNLSELPAINVGIERGDYSNMHQGQSDGDYRFFIECNTESEGEDALRGDTKSKILVQKILGMARAILENPIYKTLGFTPGQFIKHRHIEGFVFAEQIREDSSAATMARMTLVVKAVETTDLIEANLIAGWDTEVKLHDSEQGYYWSKEV